MKLLSSHPRHLQFTAFAKFRNSCFQATFSTSVFLNSFLFLPGESRAHRRPSTLATSSSGTFQSQQCEPVRWLNSSAWLFLVEGSSYCLGLPPPHLLQPAKLTKHVTPCLPPPTLSHPHLDRVIGIDPSHEVLQ